MYQRLLMAILFGFLAFGSASAQESGAAYQPTLADNPAKPVAQPSKSLRLTGVLISRINRTALVNGRPDRTAILARLHQPVDACPTATSVFNSDGSSARTASMKFC